MNSLSKLCMAGLAFAALIAVSSAANAKSDLAGAAAPAAADSATITIAPQSPAAAAGL